MPDEYKEIENWAPIEGIWEFGQSPIATFLRPEEVPNERSGTVPNFGIALSNVRFASGQINATVTLPHITDAGANQIMGHILLGYTNQASSIFKDWTSPT